MYKRTLSPLELLSIATRHASSADYLLQQIANGKIRTRGVIDMLTPVTSLIYLAFQLTLKAYCQHDHRPIKEYKNLTELVELNKHLGFSSKDLTLLKMLAKQQVFNKGLAYDLWDNFDELHVFCEELLALYARVHDLMPVELTEEYTQDTSG
jgi:hypothetical protein